MIYLEHPIHGVKIAYVDAEVEADKLNGWKEYAPSSEAQSVPHAQAEDEPKTSEESPADACPKCGKSFKRGLTMHVKHCKAS